MHTPINDLTGRLLTKFPGISLEVARAEAEELWAMPAFRISYMWTVSPNRYRSHDRINPFVAEFLAQGVMRRLGIGTASEQLICTADEARALSDDFVVKFDPNGWTRNLTWNPDAVPAGWCLASRVVRDAASLILGKLISIDHAHAEFQDGEELKQMFGYIDRDSKTFNVLGSVAALTEDDIRASVAEIPKHSACGSVAGLADYFCLYSGASRYKHDGC